MSEERSAAPGQSGGMGRIKGHLAEYYQNLMDIPGKENDVAVGFAIGIFISFSPWIGLHLIIIFLLTHVFRKSFGAGLLASLVFNPFTAPFFWTLEFRTGRLVIGLFSRQPKQEFKISFSDFEALWDSVVQVFYPIFIGGLVLGVPAAVLSYFLVQRSLRIYRNRVYGRVSERWKARQERRRSG
ncbi:MAG: DUF2062 domain-containing protein [bacterium]